MAITLTANLLQSQSAFFAAIVQPAPVNQPINPSIRFASKQSLPLQTAPIISNTLSGIAGVNIPIIGGASIASATTGLLSSAGLPQIAEGVSAANALATLPLSLYRRPEGYLLIGNQAANILYSHLMTRRNQLNVDDLAVDPALTDSSFKRYPVPYDDENGMSPQGGLLAPTLYKDLSHKEDGRSTYYALKYSDIAAKAEQSLAGQTLPDFRNDIPGIVMPTDQLSDVKQVLSKFNFRPTKDLVNKLPTDDLSYVDPLYSDPAGLGEDFVKVIFTDTRNNVPIQFRSYISGISDRFNPVFSDIKYIGRSNPLKMFSETSRDITLTLMVPALSRGELKWVYSKLDALSKLSMAAGVGIVIGPVFKFTLGDYLVDELCHLTSLTFDIDDTYTWEVNNEKSSDVDELPHLIKVSLGIYIIGNTVMDANTYSTFGTSIYKQ